MSETLIPTWVALLGVGVFLVAVLVLALIDVGFDYFSKISIRTYREESWKTEFLTKSLEDPMSFLLPLRIGLQGAFIAVTVLVTMLFITASPTSRSLLAAFGSVLAIFLVFREAVPNIVARKNPERVLLTLLPAYRIYAKLVTPISRPLFRFVGVFVEERDDEEAVTEQDVQAFIEAGEDEGILEGDEGRMVQSIVDLGDTMVREVMTPRPEMISVRHDATLAEVRELFIEEKHTRVPVYRESLDHIEGLIYAIDLIAFTDANPDAAIKPLIRDVRFVPETKKVAELLGEFQKGAQTLAMVVDEYGGISGIVTLEDILEEIVGEIHDEFDVVDEDIVKERDNVFLVSGRADIDELKNELDLEINGSGFETVSGYILDVTGRIPRTGEIIEHSGLRIEVVDADGQRINSVRFRRHAPESPS
jgi:CBS domain containing-hemolysin-like protein